MGKQETVQLFYQLMKDNEQLIRSAKEAKQWQSGMDGTMEEFRQALKMLFKNQKAIWDKLGEME